jgi:hypothetical protein
MPNLRLVKVSSNQLPEQADKFDLMICACGYEARATHVAKIIPCSFSTKLAVGFTDRQELEYEPNKRWFESNGFKVIEPDDSSFRSAIEGISTNCLSLEGHLRIVVDISCFNRFRMAHLVDHFRSLSNPSVSLLFVYSLAQYAAPAESTSPTTVAEPISPEFAGWRSSPDKPPAAIIGLGYEANRAIGIVDYLEIDNAAWLFSPISPIEEYASAVEVANQSLFESAAPEGRRQYYDVLDPASLFRELNTLVVLLKHKFNPILIPFGPKIFALTALLVACEQDDVGVWRVSAGIREPAADRVASQHVSALHVLFSRS